METKKLLEIFNANQNQLLMFPAPKVTNCFDPILSQKAPPPPSLVEVVTYPTSHLLELADG